MIQRNDEGRIRLSGNIGSCVGKVFNIAQCGEVVDSVEEEVRTVIMVDTPDGIKEFTVSPSLGRLFAALSSID